MALGPAGSTSPRFTIVTAHSPAHPSSIDQMGRLHPLLIAATTVAAIVGSIYLAALLVRLPAERPLAYWPIDDRTLGVVVLDAPNLSCRISQTDETGDAVRIHAQCQERLMLTPHTANAQRYVLQVTLLAPLGDRPVYDGSGNLGMLCQQAPSDCFNPY